MFFEMPAQILALIRSRQLLPARLVNIGGSLCSFPKPTRRASYDSIR